MNEFHWGFDKCHRAFLAWKNYMFPVGFEKFDAFGELKWLRYFKYIKELKNTYEDSFPTDFCSYPSWHFLDYDFTESGVNIYHKDWNFVSFEPYLEEND